MSSRKPVNWDLRFCYWFPKTWFCLERNCGWSKDSVQMKNRIRELRKQHDFRQEDLATLLGVTRQTINAIENDKYNPTLELAMKLVVLLRTSVEDLFTLERWMKSYKKWGYTTRLSTLIFYSRVSNGLYFDRKFSLRKVLINHILKRNIDQNSKQRGAAIR